MPEADVADEGAADVAWEVGLGRSKSCRTAAHDAAASSRAGYLL